MTLGSIAEAIGKGLFAGLVGTAAMTVSSTLEMKWRGREASDAPAQAAGKVLGVEPKDDKEKQRFSTLVHWGYGTTWGVARGLIALTGLTGVEAGAAHFTLIWGTALWMLPALDVAPPATQWGSKELLIDAFHHAVYATSVTTAYTYLDDTSTR